nr:PE family protein [Mycobacterium tuberculosis]
MSDVICDRGAGGAGGGGHGFGYSRLDDRRRQRGRCGLDNGVADRRRDEVSAAIAAYSECTARPIRHSVRGRRRSMSGSCRPWPQVGAPMRPPRPPASRRCRARSIC